MKQTILYLLKGLLFSCLLMGLLIVLLALIMWKGQLSDSTISLLLLGAFAIASFVGAWYFAKHAKARRFLWGLGFGAMFFLLYLAITFALSPESAMELTRALTMFAAAFVAGCIGGMLS